MNLYFTIVTAGDDYTALTLLLTFVEDQLNIRRLCGNISVTLDEVLEEEEIILVSIDTTDPAILVVQSNTNVSVLDSTSEFE